DQVYKEYSKFISSHPQDGKLKTGTEAWRELGPKSRIDNYIAYMGRVNAIAFHPTDTATIYAGAPTGGFWITRDRGRNWATSTDNQPVMGVSAISVDPINPDIILIGTGDRDISNSPGGMGVFRSEDGGLTWSPFNKGMGNVTVGMFARAADNPRIILAATNGGIFKTIDGGENWVKTSPQNANFTDMRLNSGNPSIAYAASEKGFYRSENAGDTWSLVPVSSGYINGDRMVIGITPANDSLVYLISGQMYPPQFLGCFLSHDFGRSFTRQSNSPDIIGNKGLTSQVWYDLCIQVDSINPQILIVGGILIYKSTDGGKTWQDAAVSGSLHSDHHFLAVNPLNNRLYDANDGGISYTDNAGSTWINISQGLGIGQIYKIGVGASKSGLVLAGFQDNGTAYWNGTDWITIGYGDGTECAVDPFDSTYRYVSMAETQSIYVFFKNGIPGRMIAGPGINGITDKGSWITPFILSEGDGNTMVVGYQNIWINRNIRSEGTILWKKISENLEGSSAQFDVLEQSPADVNVLPNIPLKTIVYDKSSNEGLYVGSDAGVYYRDAGMTDWILYGKSFPVSVMVTELEIYNDSVRRTGSHLYASTYGRGLWEIGLAETNPVPPGQLKASILDKSVKLTWNPPYYKKDIQGYRIYRNGNPLADISSLTFTDQAIEKDLTYHYKIKVLYMGGVESGFSNEVLATIISTVELPYTQPFEQGTGGWTAEFSIDGWNYGTSDQLGVAGREGHFFGISSTSVVAGSQVTDCLQTPVINLSTYQGKTVTLNFAYTMRKVLNYDKFSVLYRPAPDSAWVTLKNLDPPDNTAWIWDTTEINLPDKALTSQVQIGFLYDNSNKVAWGAAIDDVRIFVNTTSVNSEENKNWVRVFPNPSKGQVTLEMNTLLPDEVNLRIYSVTGQLVLERNIPCHSGITVETIDLSSQPKGIYMLSLQSKSGDWQQKTTIILYPENEGRK
ncbi:MAG: T9SS type A sorting domain-containing protein, partial [Bacteroidia bacterium]|nr:T9SS type A sorting domain-containing protein [Bacteroidia bacterium]